MPPEERDRANSPRLARKVRLRDGGVCSNPLCRRRTGLHAHHIQFRSHGGHTALCNEKVICQVCHSLVHQGLLRIEGDPLRGVRFRPKGARSALGQLVEDIGTLLSSPRVLLTAAAEPASCGGPGDPGSGESGIPDSRSIRGLIAALRSVG